MIALNHTIDRSAILDTEFHSVDMESTVNLVREAITKRMRLQLSDINVAKIVQMVDDSTLKAAVQESDLICVDGLGVVWASRLLGVPVAERVTGIDLMMRVIALCEKEGYRPYLLGARQDVIDKMVSTVKQTHPKLQLAGARNGYFKREDEAQIIEDIRRSGADCLFVGITSPLKERFLREHRDKLEVPVQMGVGGAFDVVAGRVRRAPPFVQQIGMEWMFRVLQEPRRLFWRYFTTNARFVAMVVRARLSRNDLEIKEHVSREMTEQ